MIAYDLKCGTGHVFEAWFGSSGDYDDQQARGLLACPLCDDRSVAKAVMAPAVGAKGNQRGDAQREDPKALLAKLAEMQAKLEAASDYVGDRFADEARAIHLGEAEARAIHGEATPDEARALADEGIPVAPLPFRTRRRADA
jgi:hypothetical protein